MQYFKFFQIQIQNVLCIVLSCVYTFFTQHLPKFEVNKCPRNRCFRYWNEFNKYNNKLFIMALLKSITYTYNINKNSKIQFTIKNINVILFKNFMNKNTTNPVLMHAKIFSFLVIITFHLIFKVITKHICTLISYSLIIFILLIFTCDIHSIDHKLITYSYHQ